MTWILIALALAAGYLLVGYYIFRRACRREAELPWRDPEALRGTMWAPVAERIRDSFAYLEANHAREVELMSEDGLMLHGQFLPARDPVGTILLFHGYRSSPQGDFSAVLEFYHELGFHLLLAHQRSHGKSQGKYITFGVRERLDVLRWIQWHNATFGDGDLFLGGMSMGATTVLLAAGEDLPGNVRGVIADCGFTSPWDIICREIRKEVHLPPAPLAWSAGIFARLLGKFGLREASTVEAMAHCRVPVLLIHGTGDNFVPCEMSQKAYDACKGEKTLILVEGAGHGLSYVVDPRRCRKALEQFLLEHLTR